MVIDAKNPWAAQGGDLDGQRADLWLLDFSTALNTFRPIFEFLPVGFYTLPTSTALTVSARSFDFPEMRTDAAIGKRDNVPNHFPGDDQAFQQVRITFLVPDSRRSAAAPVVSFAYAWRAIVRAGRGKYSAGDADLTLLQAGGGKSLVPRYKADVAVYTLGGSVDGLVKTATYTLKNAWLSASQLSTLSMDQSGFQTFTMVLYAEAVIPGQRTGSHSFSAVTSAVPSPAIGGGSFLVA